MLILDQLSVLANFAKAMYLLIRILAKSHKSLVTALLESIDQNVYSKISSSLKSLNHRGVPIWLLPISNKFILNCADIRYSTMYTSQDGELRNYLHNT